MHSTSSLNSELGSGCVVNMPRYIADQSQWELAADQIPHQSKDFKLAAAASIALECVATKLSQVRLMQLFYSFQRRI